MSYLPPSGYGGDPHLIASIGGDPALAHFAGIQVAVNPPATDPDPNDNPAQQFIYKHTPIHNLYQMDPTNLYTFDPTAVKGWGPPVGLFLLGLVLVGVGAAVILEG